MTNALKALLLVVNLDDDAGSAIRRAVVLAAQHRARLVVLSAGPGRSGAAGRSAVDAQLAERRVHRTLARLARELHHGHELRWLSPAGDADTMAQIVAATAQADLVVLSGGTGGWLRTLLFGTPTERIVRLAGRPVLVVKHAPAAAWAPCAPYRRALVTLDLAQAAAPALDWAARLAPQARLHLLHALSVPLVSRLRLADGSATLQRTLVERASAASLHRLWCLAAGVTGQRTLTTVAEGPPAALALSKGRETGADLIVVGKHPRQSLLADFLLGSTTRQLLAEAATDVLVVPLPAPATAASTAATRPDAAFARGSSPAGA